MSDFDLDLQSAEDQLDFEDGDGAPQVELGVLDGETDPEEWTEAVLERGSVLVLNVDGDLNRLAAAFARDVKNEGGELMHFRGFLVVVPPGVRIDADRLD
jgi:hypothetical protein